MYRHVAIFKIKQQRIVKYIFIYTLIFYINLFMQNTNYICIYIYLLYLLHKELFYLYIYINMFFYLIL